MDVSGLRAILEPRLLGLKNAGTHEKLPSICRALGLPAPGAEGSKQERIKASLDTVSDDSFVEIARRFLIHHPPDAATRNLIEDILWTDGAQPEISKRVRREIARALESEPLYEDPRRFDELLDRLWVLDDEPWEGLLRHSNSLRAKIERHVHRNPGDWSTEMLFDQLGAYESSDRRFGLFLEGLASAEVRPDEAAQRSFVACVNTVLKTCGLELAETGTDSGYPIFSVVSLHSSTRGRPKNLIFASHVKPDLRFRDALDNEIEIVTNADKVLIYDRPISAADGLRWSDLQQWWMESHGMTSPDDAKRSLYKRLVSSLPPESPPQLAFFKAFYSGYQAAIPGLPALLPEVWLHWDPRTVKARGRDALLRLRMDFLLLLPHGIRVVIEIDGKQHYSSPDGQADTRRYAETMKADRELKLAGYEVFRFAGVELHGTSVNAEVKSFFDALFKLYGVAT